MDIFTKEKSGIYIIILKGEVDLYNAPQIKELIISQVNNKMKNFIIDLNDVTYIDSTGIGSLIFSRSTIQKNGGKLSLSNVKDSVKKIFELTKLDNLFQIFDNEEDAIKSFK